MQTAESTATAAAAPGPLRVEASTDQVARLSPLALAAGTLLLAWIGLWNKLRVDWTINEQYQYGWFVPPLALALLAMRWKDRPEPYPPGKATQWFLGVSGFVALLLLGPLRLAEGPNPDWRLVFWIHGLVLTVISFALAAWCGGWPWLRHFAFPVGFLLMAVPWPSGPEQAVIQGLMRDVAAIAAECMAVLGVPALAHGNVLSVHGQLVGVNEACSGIRSLQTTLMASLFLGELSRLGLLRRIGLLTGGVLIALVANVFRSSLLVWIAAQSGVAALEHYHDATGITVLFIVFASLLGLNSLLGRSGTKRPMAPEAASSRSSRAAAPPVSVIWLALGWLAMVELGNLWWYSAPPAGLLTAMPHWTVGTPSDVTDVMTLPIDDRTASMLRYDQGKALRWSRPGDAGAADDCTLFFFRWDPGHASSLQADMHQPHICLTASGLKQTADWGVQPVALPDGLTLPVRRYEFTLQGRTLYVFFIVWQDGVSGRPDAAEEPGSRAARLRAVLERRPLVGRQTLEFLVTGPATPEEANRLFEQELRGIVQRQD